MPRPRVVLPLQSLKCVRSWQDQRGERAQGTATLTVAVQKGNKCRSPSQFSEVKPHAKWAT